MLKLASAYLIKSRLGIFLFFVVIALFFFRGIILTPGVIIGNDWAFPSTVGQMEQSFKNSTLTWSNQGFLLGSRQSLLHTLPINILFKLFAILGITGNIHTKLILIFLISFSGYSMYLLARFFRLNTLFSILAGLFYITAPIVFNYSIMGWQFVLLVMGILPLFVLNFIRSVQENNKKYTVIAGILYALSILQSQSVLWLMMIGLVVSIYVVRDKRSFFIYLKSLSIVVIIFFLLNFYWLLGVLLSTPQVVSGSDLIKSAVSMGTSGRLQPLEIIRLWGSLSNYMYESTIINSGLKFLSFIMPFLAICSLFSKKRGREIALLWLIAVIPILLYLLNLFRDLLVYIPFANVVRDFSRFAILSTFAYSLLAVFFLEHLMNIKSHQKAGRYLAVVLISIWTIYIFPWWTGNVTDWNNRRECYDSRLHTRVFPHQYNDVDRFFLTEKEDQKALFIPFGGILDFKDDYAPYEKCNAVWDIFAAYSPIPGVVTITDRDLGQVKDYINAINTAIGGDFLPIIYPTNIHYIVLRKNAIPSSDANLFTMLQALSKQNIISTSLDNDKVVIYTLPHSLPHWYIPQTVAVTKSNVTDFYKITSKSNYKINSAIYFKTQNKGQIDKLNALSNSLEGIHMEFKKISNVKYRVLVHKARKPFPLVFNEAYHKDWKLYLIGNQNLDIGLKGNFVSHSRYQTIQNDNLRNGNLWETFFKRHISDGLHLTANAYANSWIIDPGAICKDNNICARNSDGSYELEFVAEFWQQRILYLGFTVSAFTLIGCLIYIRTKKYES